MKKLINWCCILWMSLLANNTMAQSDTTYQLSYLEFLDIVKQYHPLAYSYRLQNNIAKADVLKARGNFDPLLDAKTGTKTIDAIEYYTESNVGLQIPTWYGIDITGSYTNIDGQRINNSDTRGGLYQMGITIPLAKNLLYDKRRAQLDQAKYALEMTAAEQELLTNELLLEAENTYWNWVLRYEIFLLQSQAVTINQERLEFIMKSFEYGERAAIDTTEALSQLQSFELAQKDAYLQFVKATQELALFLWKENQEAYDIAEGLVPTDKITNATAYDAYPQLLETLASSTLNQHNALQYYYQKQRILESERKLKRQSFLPKLDFTYNFFSKDVYAYEFLPFFQNNYQYGLKLEIPLFYRQARADYQIAKAKILQNEMDANFKQQEIVTKINTYRNEVLNYRAQIDLIEGNIANYEKLLDAENSRYENGESSLFLINSRENKLIETQEKMLELRYKFIKGYNELKWINENLRTP